MRIRASVALLTSFLMVIAGCSTKSATPIAAPSSSDITSSLLNAKPVDLRTAFNESENSVNDYWTPEKVKAVEPGQPLVENSTGEASPDEPNQVELAPSGGALGTPKPAGQVTDGRPW